MLKLNVRIRITQDAILVNSNTTLVKVKCCLQENHYHQSKTYSNTTLVKVKLYLHHLSPKKHMYSNTTLVKVKSVEAIDINTIRKGFKYNTC